MVPRSHLSPSPLYLPLTRYWRTWGKADRKEKYVSTFYRWGHHKKKVSSSYFETRKPACLFIFSEIPHSSNLGLALFDNVVILTMCFFPLRTRLLFTEVTNTRKSAPLIRDWRRSSLMLWWVLAHSWWVFLSKRIEKILCYWQVVPILAQPSYIACNTYHT